MGCEVSVDGLVSGIHRHNTGGPCSWVLGVDVNWCVTQKEADVWRSQARGSLA